MSEDEREITLGSNCITYWLPPLISAGLPVPKTKIIKTSSPLIMLIDDKKPEGWESFLDELLAAMRVIGTPCFLRTGHGSAKHEWKRTCYIAKPDVDKVARHVCRLVEWSELTSIMGLPTDVWAVRELLPTTPSFHAFSGEMPIVREFRFFVEDAKVICGHPYWPPDSIHNASRDDWQSRLADMNLLADEDEHYHLFSLASRAGEAVGGSWSVDMIQTTRGWFITDMALAEQSYHWPGCRFAEATGKESD